MPQPQLNPPRVYTQPCRKCQGTLYRVTTGNVVDFRHPGGEFLCPKPQSSKPQPLTRPTWTDRHWWDRTEPSQDQYALDA